MRANFSLGMKKDWKSDNTPLTITDTSINKLVIKEIKKNFPEHSLLGEEESMMHNSEYVWVCDPVDGTIPFSHGCPTFMFSLALTRNGKSILGVLYDPMMDRMFYAEKGKGAFLNGKRTRVSKAEKLKNKMINLDADLSFGKIFDPGFRDALMKRDVFAATIYSSTYASSLVACGEFVAEIYTYDKPWDGAAVKVIVEEAGGRVTDIFGKEQRWDRGINGFIASNGAVHEKLLQLMRVSLRKNGRNH